MDRVMFRIGSFNIYWYSALILIAFFVGSLIAISYTKKTKVSITFITDLIFWLIPVSIIGARLYYVIFNFDLYRDDIISIFKIWEGGLAIYGGIIASLIFIYFRCKQKEQVFIDVLDILAPSLILGQAIGRWGNFFNGEAYGPVTTLDSLHNLHIPQFIIEGMNIGGAYHQPLFFYESIGCLIGFIILLIIRSKLPKKGTQTYFYLLWYGMVRVIIEFFRTDSLYIFNLKVSMIVSILLIIIGLLGILKNKGKFAKTSNEVVNESGRI